MLPLYNSTDYLFTYFFPNLVKGILMERQMRNEVLYFLIKVTNH